MSRHTEDTKVATVEIDKLEVDCYFDGKKAFYATVLDERVTSTSLDNLKEKIRKRLRAGDLRLAIPCSLIEIDDDTGGKGVSIQDIVLVGTEARHGRILYRGVDQSNSTSETFWEGYHRRYLTARLTPEQAQTLVDLRDAAFRAEQAVLDFQEAHAIEDPKHLIAVEKQKLIDQRQVGTPRGSDGRD